MKVVYVPRPIWDGLWDGICAVGWVLVCFVTWAHPGGPVAPPPVGKGISPKENCRFRWRVQREKRENPGSAKTLFLASAFGCRNHVFRQNTQMVNLISN